MWFVQRSEDLYKQHSRLLNDALKSRATILQLLLLSLAIYAGTD